PSLSGGGAPNASGPMTDFYSNSSVMHTVVAGGVNNFELVFDGTPFIYNPALGNLLVEVVATNSNTTYSVSRSDGSTEASRAYIGGRFGGAMSPTTAARMDFTFAPVGGMTGACCLPDGSCIQTTSAFCASQNGIYRGDNSPCS